jgi:hypothetical protein
MDKLTLILLQAKFRRRYFDTDVTDDYTRLMRAARPSPWRRFLRWLISLLTKTGKAV